jgi:RNA polymerase sigma-70 factor (ECF subfamily)
MGGNDDPLAEGREAEAELIEAAQRDPAGFAVLYEDNFDVVYAFVARRVGDRTEAEDLTSIVFHKALAALPRYEWRGVPFAAWLLRIAHNEVARRQRRRDTEPLVAEPAVDDAELEDVERRATTFRLLRVLPAEQRRVLTMRFAHDQSLRQVAAALGKSEGAVKQLQHRGLETLRRLQGAV